MSGKSSAGVVDTTSPVTTRVDDALEPELLEPLAAAAAGRRRDRDRFEVARRAARRYRACERRLLGADPERIGGVLDVDAEEGPSVACPHGSTDQEAEYGAYARGCDLNGRVVQLLVGGLDRHQLKNSWKTTSVTSAPSKPP